MIDSTLFYRYSPAMVEKRPSTIRLVLNCFLVLAALIALFTMVGYNKIDQQQKQAEYIRLAQEVDKMKVTLIRVERPAYGNINVSFMLYNKLQTVPYTGQSHNWRCVQELQKGDTVELLYDETGINHEADSEMPSHYLKLVKQ